MANTEASQALARKKNRKKTIPRCKREGGGKKNYPYLDVVFFFFVVARNAGGPIRECVGVGGEVGLGGLVGGWRGL